MARSFLSKSLFPFVLSGSLLSGTVSLAAPPEHSRFLLGAYRKTMEIEGEIQASCDRYGVPVRLARAVCMYESGGNDSLVSGAGARGYFQVMPATQRLMGVPSNIEAGVKYLGEMIHAMGREDDALAAYNAGPGRITRGRSLPMETLQYVLGVGHLRTLLVLDEAGLRVEASGILLHKVSEGESWMDISEATGITLLELRLYNPYLADRPLRAGQTVAHPQEPATAAADILQWSQEKSCWVYHTLPGDLYHHLAIAFGVPLERMRSDNELWRVQAPVAGMALQVRPGSDEPGESHVVQQGETLASIARDYSASEWEIVRENGLWDQKLEAGHALRILPAGRVVARRSLPPSAASPAPGAGATPATLAAAQEVSDRPSAPAQRFHRVRRGETLGHLARLYGTTVQMLRGLNGLRGSRLSVGQVLRIPISATS